MVNAGRIYTWQENCLYYSRNRFCQAKVGLRGLRCGMVVKKLCVIRGTQSFLVWHRSLIALRSASCFASSPWCKTQLMTHNVKATRDTDAWSRDRGSHIRAIGSELVQLM